MRKKRLLSMLLCLMMLVSIFPSSVFAVNGAGLVTPGDSAKLELVYMEYNEGVTDDNMWDGSAGPLLCHPADVPETIEADQEILIGIRLSGIEKIKEVAESNAGLYNIQPFVAYDPNCLTYTDGTGDALKAAVELRIGTDATTGLFKKSKGVMEYKIDDTSCVTDVASTTPATSGMKVVAPTVAFKNDKDAPTYKGGADDSKYLAIIRFTATGNKPASGKKAIQFDSSQNAAITFGIGGAVGSYEGNHSSGAYNSIFTFDESAANLFPQKAAPIGGTASIDGTLTYGETLTVNTGSVTGVDSGKFTYQWSDGTNNIGTEKTLVVNNSSWVGKTLTCVVKPADTTEASGSVTATAAAPIAKKQLTVSGTTITAKTFDNKTNATATGTTLAGKVGSDVVNVTATAAFADKNAGTNKDVTVNYTLSGAAAGAYELDKTSETLKGTINKKQLTVGIENKSVKIGQNVTLNGKVTGEVAGASADVTYTYVVKDGSTDIITVAGDKATGVATGSKAVTVTGTIGNTTNYEFAAGGNTADATVTVTDKVPTGITIKTQPTKLSYEAGETLNLTGLVVTVVYDNDDTTAEDVALADFAGKSITATPANGTALTVADHDKKPVTVSINGKTATTSNLTVTAATTKVTLKTKGVATKKYDGTTAVTSWTTEPVFESNNGTVDTNKAVYTFAQAGVGTNLDITVTGLTVNGEAASISGSVADGTITIGDTTLAITSSASQTVGSVRIAVNATPTDPLRTIKIMSYQVVTPAAAEVPCSHATVTDGAICTNVGACDHTDGCGYVPATAEEKGWVELTDSQIAGLKEGKYTLKAVSDATANTTAGASDEFNLTVNKKSSGGGGGGGSVVTEYTVKFSAGDHGKLEGKLSVTVAKDGSVKSADIPKVTPEEGYVFAGWTLDGKTTVDPTAAKVTANVNYTALYKASKGTHGTFMSGYTDGTFRPDGNTTRAEVASLMAGLIEGYDKNGTYTTSLNDIDSNEWYAQAVKFMSAQGLITGYDDGSFRPTRQITRQEFCAIIAKYLDLKNEGTTDFNDVADAWGQGFIAQLATKGIVSGYPDGSFMPDKAITRAEVTTILNKVFDRVPDQKLVDENIGNYTVRMSDVTKDHWAYYQILEAAMEHEVADFH